MADYEDYIRHKLIQDAHNLRASIIWLGWNFYPEPDGPDVRVPTAVFLVPDLVFTNEEGVEISVRGVIVEDFTSEFYVMGWGVTSVAEAPSIIHMFSSIITQERGKSFEKTAYEVAQKAVRNPDDLWVEGEFQGFNTRRISAYVFNMVPEDFY